MELFPVGLSRELYAMLSQHQSDCNRAKLAAALVQVEKKLLVVRQAQKENAYINVALADAIAGRIRSMAERWQSIPSHARPWCYGVIRYFIHDQDSEPDFSSPIGFEDDAEVLNACVRLAGMDDLILNPEDYDDVC